MESKEIYDCIKAKYPDLETVICFLHKPCIGNPCSKVSAKKVLDFDCVECRFHVGVQPSPSVDAVTYNEENSIFYFVEIKGWEKFYTYQLKPFDEEDWEAKIEVQVKDYDLEGKLDNSLSLCQDITANKDCFENTELIYVLVTDIEVEMNPLQSIAYNLAMLSETSSKWKDLCNKYLFKRLDDISDIKKLYVYCKDFDLRIGKK